MPRERRDFDVLWTFSLAEEGKKAYRKISRNHRGRSAFCGKRNLNFASKLTWKIIDRFACSAEQCHELRVCISLRKMHKCIERACVGVWVCKCESRRKRRIVLLNTFRFVPGADVPWGNAFGLSVYLQHTSRIVSYRGRGEFILIAAACGCSTDDFAVYLLLATRNFV